LSFTAEAGSSVRLYTDGTCATSIGSPVTIGAGGVGSISATVNANSSTTFYANATDAAGNVSNCSAGFTYVNDFVPPAAPTITSTTPASPNAASTSPTLNITNPEVGTDILIYSGNTCSGAIVTTINNAGATASTSVTVAANSTSVFTAKTRDAAGNLSPCSSSISYTHDSNPPAAPSIFESIPSSPGDAINPLLKVSGEAGSTVTIYPNATGTGAPIATGTASGSGEVWFGPYYNVILNNLITVSNGSTNKFTAKSTDASGNVSATSSIFYYNHVLDNIAPGNVSISSSPTSPGNSTAPTLTIICEHGAKVNLYDNLTATGTPIATQYDTNYDGDVQFQVSVLNNSTNKYSARQTDASGNVSASFGTFTYVHDNVPPSTPIIVSSSPVSPNNLSTTPLLNFTADAGSSVRLYTDATCTTFVSPAVTTSAGGTGAITVTVNTNSSTTFYSNATDAAGNVSPCSAGFTYVHSNL